MPDLATRYCCGSWSRREFINRNDTCTGLSLDQWRLQQREIFCDLWCVDHFGTDTASNLLDLQVCRECFDDQLASAFYAESVNLISSSCLSLKASVAQSQIRASPKVRQFQSLRCKHSTNACNLEMHDREKLLAAASKSQSKSGLAESTIQLIYICRAVPTSPSLFQFTSWVNKACTSA